MLNKDEITMIAHAIEIKKDQLKRAANTEKDQAVRELRQQKLQEYSNLQNKITTKGLFDEPQISKQK